MSGYDDPELTGEPRRRPFLAIEAAVLMLVVGLAVGFVLGGGAVRDSSVAAPVDTAPPSPPSTTVTPADPDPVPQPCLAAGSAGTRVLQELEAALAAIVALVWGLILGLGLLSGSARSRGRR